jgi:hypothetical protein
VIRVRKTFAGFLALFSLYPVGLLAAPTNSPVIFSGQYAKTLVPYINLKDRAYIVTGTANPSVTATDGPQGSVYLRTGASGGAIYVKQDDGLTTNWTSVSASGLITGPGSATDNALVRWDGTTGLFVQNSVASLTDAGTLEAVQLILSGLTASTVPYVNSSKQFTSSAVTPTELGYSSGVTSSLCGINQSCTFTNKTLAVGSNSITSTADRVAQFNSGTGNLEPSSTIDTTELGYLNSVTSSLCGINQSCTETNKTLAVASNSITSTANRAAQFNSSTGNLEPSSTIDTTELGYLNGVTASLCGTSQSCTLTNKVLSGNTAVSLVSGSGTLTINTSGTVTLPNATDTLVGKATTDTLTNKTFDADGTGNSITNIENADIKSGAAIARDKIANGTANHVVINNGSGTFSSEASLSVSRGGTGLNTLTAYNVMLGNGTAPPLFVAPSTSGNLLVSDGTSWTSAAASSQKEIWLTTGNGLGSTNTTIRRFTNVTVNQGGTAMTLTQSSTNGDSITINEAGVYSFTLTDGKSGASSGVAISKNSAQLTTSGANITNTTRICFHQVPANDGGTCSVTLWLAVNDVIRAHVQADMDLTTVVAFRAIKVSR